MQIIQCVVELLNPEVREYKTQSTGMVFDFLQGRGNKKRENKTELPAGLWIDANISAIFPLMVSIFQESTKQVMLQ